MKLNRIFFIVIIVLTNMIPISCKKKGDIKYKFDGTVLGSTSNEPVSAVKVTLSQKLIENGGASDFSFAASALTDASGKFSMVIDRKKVTNFSLEFEKEDYFPINWIESSANISTEEINTIDQNFEPNSWVVFHLKNAFPNADDHFKLITQTFREGCEGCAENTTTNFYGPLDTNIVYLTTPGEYVKFTYVNVTTSFSRYDSVYTTPFENNVYEVIY